MSPRTRTFALVAVTAAATAAATTVLPTVARQTPTAVAATAAEAINAPAAPLVTGLPDFTQLVDRVGPAVVNIEATGSGGGRAIAGMPGQDEMPEFFRRFFGPSMPMPGGPGGPQGQDDDEDGGPEGPKSVSIGTGFLISEDGYLLTNHHVVEGATEVKVKLSDRREFQAKVVGSDPQSDVAVLKIPASGLPYLRNGDSKALKPGQWVVAIGSPFGLDHSVTAGIVSAVGRAANAEQRYVPFIQTDVAINRGNSGGPLLNTRGEVVGINSQIFSNSGGYMGVSFAIPMDVAMNVAQQLRTSGKVSRGQIGVTVQQLDAEKAAGLGLSEARGALVNEVRAGSPAESAGIIPGDVIQSVDDIAIEDSSDLPPVIGSMPPGKVVKITIARNGKKLERQITLTRLGDDVPRGSAVPGNDFPKGEIGRPQNSIGLVGRDLTESERRELGLKSGEGVGLISIQSKAARIAGLRVGDVVLQVGGAKVGNVSDLNRELQKKSEDRAVVLLVRRGGINQFIAVKG
jgi:serine protease Do